MTLLTQLVGVLGATVLIAVLVHGRASRPAIASSTAALGVVVVALLGLQGIWPAVKSARGNATAQRALTPAQITAFSASGIGVNGPFVEWALGKMGGGTAPFFVAGANPVAPAFMGFKALPRLMTTTGRGATWVVFYDTTPAQAGFHPGQFASFATYRPSYSIGKLKAAGR